eukprot:1907589-Rhodomonas_salina.1
MQYSVPPHRRAGDGALLPSGASAPASLEVGEGGTKEREPVRREKWRKRWTKEGGGRGCSKEGQSGTWKRFAVCQERQEYVEDGTKPHPKQRGTCKCGDDGDDDLLDVGEVDTGN